MNVEYLKTFLVVAESENFTDAAKILHKTQPAISLQIKSLEDHYDCLLFERTKRKLILTQAGKIFQAYAEDILHKFNALDNEINKLLNKVKGSLVIGASFTIGEFFLPSLLSKINYKYKDLKIVLEISNTDNILEGVQDNRYELGLVEGNVDIDLPYEVFAEDEMAIIVPKGHTITTKKEIDITDFLQYPIIVREKGSGTRRILEEALQKHQKHFDFDRSIVMELGSTQAIKNALKEGVGIAVLSRWTVKEELELGLLDEVFFCEFTLKRTFKMVWKKTLVQNLKTTTFVKELRNYTNYGILHLPPNP